MRIAADVTFHPGWWHKNAGIRFDRDFFYSADTRIEADIKMRRLLYDRFGDLRLGEKQPEPRPILGSDLIASGFLHSEIMGCDVRYSDANPPEVICKNMTDDELESLQPPQLGQSGVWLETLAQARELQKRFGYVEPCLNLMGVQNIALDLRGSELFVDYYANAEAAKRLLGICTDLSVELGRVFRKFAAGRVSAGVSAIVKQTMPEVYLTSNCSVEMVSTDIYSEFLLPCDNRLASEFAPFGIHHCGQTMEHVVEGYALVNGLRFAEVGAFSDLAKVRRALPDVFLNARYSPVRLKHACFDEMKQEISALMGNGGPAELLSASCVGIDSEVPDRNVRDFLRACLEM